MVIYVQHFVSQRLGRGIGTVDYTDGECGRVHIELTEPDVHHLDYDFKVADFAGHCPDQAAFDQTVLRIAIAQAHRDLRKPAGTDGAQRLSTGVLPWLGDLGAAPYGGGTVGFLRRTGFMDERRQGNQPLEASVDTALQMRKVEGRRAARCYLEQASVPESIIRRVLSHSAQRRKTRQAPDQEDSCCTRALVSRSPAG